MQYATLQKKAASFDTYGFLLVIYQRGVAPEFACFVVTILFSKYQKLPRENH